MNNMCYGYIYLIEDTTNGMKYVGQHKYDKYFQLDNSYHGSGKIIKDIRKSRKETLKECFIMNVETIEEANFFERYFIYKYDTIYPNGYNYTEGGDDNPMNNEETVIKHREIMKSQEVRRKIKENTPTTCGENNGMFGKGYLVAGEKNGMYGKHHTEEVKQHLREVFSGENNPQFGKKGELATCYGRTGEKHPFFGKHQTEESKNRISETLRERYNKPQNQKVCRCLLYIYRNMFKYKQKEIASILNIHVTTIQKYLKKYNINNE